MITIVGGLVGGFGLFFMGMRLLSEHLMLLSNRRLRMSAARWTQNRWTGLGWGAIAGAATQTMPALTFILVGMLRSGLLSVRRALPILLGGNLGVTLLLLVVMLDIKLAVLYVLGVSQVMAMLASHRAVRYRTMAVALFGMGMMILGFLLLKESVAPLANYPWFTDTVEWAGGSPFLCLAAGLVLCVIVQSSSVVTISGMSMAIVGIFGVEQVMMLHFGSCFGSSLVLFLMSANLTGRSRQVAMYQVLYNFVYGSMFIPLIYLEAHFDVALVSVAIGAIDLPLEQILGTFFIFATLISSLLLMTLLGPAARLLDKLWPPTEAERLSTPWFIHDGDLKNAVSSLRLADREQRRLLEILSRCLDSVRQGTEMGPLREAARTVLTRVEEFLHDVGQRYPDQRVDDHVSMLTRQRLLFWLDERVLELCDELHAMPGHVELEDWRSGLVEGIDAVLLVLQDMLNSSDEGSWALAMRLMSGRSELMRKMRGTYLGDDSILSSAQRSNVLRITSITEHIFLLLSRLAHEYQPTTDDAALQSGESELQVV